jgi:hypothetical protein
LPAFFSFVSHTQTIQQLASLQATVQIEGLHFKKFWFFFFFSLAETTTNAGQLLGRIWKGETNCKVDSAG